MSDLKSRQKSRDYPGISLRKAVDFAQRIYEKDRWIEAPIESAARHMGYSGLNGRSRPALSALRKFGLLGYIGSGAAAKVKLTDLAKQILIPVNAEEKPAAIVKALHSPKIYAEIAERFPDWQLPSDESFSHLLEREFGLQAGAVPTFLKDLRESIEFAKAHGSVETHAHDDQSAENSDSTAGDMTGSPGPTHQPTISLNDILTLRMSGSVALVQIPDPLTPAEGKRILQWMDRVVRPAIEFAAEDIEESEA